MSLFDFLKPKAEKSKSNYRNSSNGRSEPRLMSDSTPSISEPKLISEPEDYSPETIYMQKKQAISKKKKRKKQGFFTLAFRWLFSFFLRIAIFIAVIIGIYIGYLYIGLPDINKLGEFKKTPSIIVKAEDGTVIGTYGDVYGDYIPFNQLPKDLINGVVATEDRNFFHHFGVDPKGLARAMYTNFRARRMVQGGSTITQQVAKNVFLTSERTLKRKLQEMLLAFKLEKRYSKQEILTIYLNRVYMGAGNYGVDSAAKRYFGHSVREISLSESAILVGLLKAPTRYAPTNNPDLSEKRATQVLFNMKDAGYLTQAQMDAAKANFDDEDSSYRDNHTYGAFYFSDWVVGQLSQIPEYAGYSKEDIIITTTLKPEWQHFAEDAVTTVLDEKGKAMRASQAAVFSMTPDGAIRAMVGGRNYRSSQFNRVTQAFRQPGSSFKLFVYLAGLQAGFMPDSEMVDQPIHVGNWNPRNYSGKYVGRITLRAAFAESINSIAVQLSETVGRNHVIEMAQKLGVTSELTPDPSIALGSNEVNLFDMTTAYAHLANNGLSVLPFAIKKIETPDGKVIFEKTPVIPGEVLPLPTVKMMNNMLIAVTTSGSGRGAQFGRPIAGKTGTTSDYRDAWFIGFTPELVTGVWVGNDDTSPMKKVSGGSLPASIWRGYMSQALKDTPISQIPNQSDNGSGGILPWITGNSPATQPPSGTTQPLPFVNPHAAPAENEPEEEPVPEYNAPPSFWDKLLGSGNHTGHN